MQSQHRDHEATTIFPAPVFINWRGRAWAYSFQVFRDDMAQDSAWVQYVMSNLLKDKIPALLRSRGADPMTRAAIFTENVPKQFKCRFHFGLVADSGIMCLNNKGLSTGEKGRWEHHYFGACHGKNISDSESGITKTYARDSVINETWTVASPRDLWDKLSKALKFMLRDPTGERGEKFAAEGRIRRSEQLLVTKVISVGVCRNHIFWFDPVAVGDYQWSFGVFHISRPPYLGGSSLSSFNEFLN